MNSLDSIPLKPLPGEPEVSPVLLSKLRAAWAQRHPGYIPRTRHRHSESTPFYLNRLFLETSPYLLQHAHNPVNWYPWGDEAFETAKELGRPVLLSVGYSTCHWCHVMEEESFEDEAIAKFINEHYIPVKVDREERPDVDAQYMTAIQAINGQGGWPMTVWLSPDRTPFYGGTYFPPRNGSRGTRVGFLTLLAELERMYQRDPEKIAHAAAQLVGAVWQRLGGESPGHLPTAALLDHAFTYYHRAFDPEHGGIGHAPKFPQTLPVRWLLRYNARTGNEQALEMASLTLAKMAGGGIYDHVAGGFHRYSVDEEWLVPHFEKMLYDNALLVPAYLEGYQVTGRQDFADVARDILTYMDRDLSAPDGGFFAATDADSPNPTKQGEREEGWYFTWTLQELSAILTTEEVQAVVAYYRVTPNGNFEGRSIFHHREAAKTVASGLGLTEAELAKRLGHARPKLAHARSQRPPPILDDKVLAAWNGLAVSAFARGSQVLQDVGLLTRAQSGIDFILSHMMKDERLYRTYKNGETRVLGFLEDYSFVLQALLDVYEAGFDLKYLDAAKRLADVTMARFSDAERGGFFATSDEHESLMVREKPAYDGATPSGNSIMTLSLLRLAELTGIETYRQSALRTICAFSETLHKAPAALAEMLLALEFHLNARHQFILITKHSIDEAKPFLECLHHRFFPNRILAATSMDKLVHARSLIPHFKDRDAGPAGVAAYICRDFTCLLPAHDPESFAQQLEDLHD